MTPETPYDAAPPDPAPADAGAPDAAPAEPAGTGHGLAGQLVAFAVPVLALVVLAAPVGAIWAALAPQASITAMGGLDVEDKAYIAADGVFFLLTLGMGVLSGVLGWRLRRGRPVAVVLGLAVGGVLAGIVAARVGGELGLRSASQGALALRRFAVSKGGQQGFDPTLHVRAGAVLLAWGLGAATAFLASGYLRRKQLPAGRLGGRADPEPEPVSSG